MPRDIGRNPGGSEASDGVSAAWHDSAVFGGPVRVDDMTGDDLEIAHVPTPVETGDISFPEHREYGVLDVILLGEKRSSLYALVQAQRPRY